jgi:hypothetical protein
VASGGIKRSIWIRKNRKNPSGSGRKKKERIRNEKRKRKNHVVKCAQIGNKYLDWKVKGNVIG